MRTTRRQFLATTAGSAALMSFDSWTPTVLLEAAEQSAAGDRNDAILVVVQLTGGNDGLNTVVPFRDDLYYRARPKLAIPADKVLQISDELGFHPSCAGLAELAKSGELAIVQGVGYPNPNRSHFESMDIWHTCQRKEQRNQDGWLGRLLDQRQDAWGPDSPAMHLGAEKQPYALAARQVRTPSVQSVERFRLQTAGSGDSFQAIQRLTNAARDNASPLLDFVKTTAQSALTTSQRIEKARREYQSAVEYPGSGLAQKLRTVAQMIDAGLGTRIYYMELDGFDTHSQQADAHTALINEFSQAVKAFWDDLAKHGHADRVLLMSFSEFGRRVQENASEGTDHGAAGPMFLVGRRLRGGLQGRHPSLTDLDDGDLKFHTDFRQVFAAVLEQWFACPSEPILGGKFAPVELLT